MPAVELATDVHCVTGWSALDQQFKGVRIADLADRAGVRSRARHVVFEAAAGYTANVPLHEALAAENLVTWQLNGESLARTHGGPVRGLVPALYFWKSAKWLTGIRFVERDEPGYWETRGYHNHADPWREERYG
jgi:DMSO/TMAO reductase YedYZ molybdopterin-dependent catalytic subunit